MKRVLIILAGLSMFAAPALAGELLGNWQNVTGTSRIRIAPCGEGFCGDLTWLNDPNTKAKLGQRVFIGLKPAGDGWKGKAFDPDDGKTYDGSATLSGSTLTTTGCALGGLVCRSEQWTRMK